MSGYTYDTEFMRNAVGYVPAQSVDMKWSEEDVAGFDAWLAQVRRDAARDALAAAEEYALRRHEAACHALRAEGWRFAREAVRDYRDAHYPKEDA